MKREINFTTDRRLVSYFVLVEEYTGDLREDTRANHRQAC
jgi:hypothetical protein